MIQYLTDLSRQDFCVKQGADGQRSVLAHVLVAGSPYADSVPLILYCCKRKRSVNFQQEPWPRLHKKQSGPAYFKARPPFNWNQMKDNRNATLDLFYSMTRAFLPMIKKLDKNFNQCNLYFLNSKHVLKYLIFQFLVIFGGKARNIKFVNTTTLIC